MLVSANYPIINSLTCIIQSGMMLNGIISSKKSASERIVQQNNKIPLVHNSDPVVDKVIDSIWNLKEKMQRL